VPPDTYPRRKNDQSDRDKLVAVFIDQLRDLERKTDPKDGAISARGKNFVALNALKIAGDLVNELAGWALDHQAGLALKEPEFVPVSTPNIREHPDYSHVRSPDDDHRHEWHGRNWAGREGDRIDPIVGRKWLMNLIRSNPGFFNLELRLMALTALEACDYGEIQPMLMATKKGRKVNLSILHLQLRAIRLVHGREARGIKKFKALEEVARAFCVSVNTVRSWERRLRTEFGPIEIAHRPATAEKVDVTQSDFRYEQDLAENARQYKMATAKKAKRAPQR
jgi:DNA-binding transcriptional regulator YiaG